MSKSLRLVFRIYSLPYYLRLLVNFTRFTFENQPPEVDSVFRPGALLAVGLPALAAPDHLRLRKLAPAHRAAGHGISRLGAVPLPVTVWIGGIKEKRGGCSLLMDELTALKWCLGLIGSNPPPTQGIRLLLFYWPAPTRSSGRAGY